MIGAPPPGIVRRPVRLVPRLLQPGPVALLTSRHRGRQNVLPVAWHMPISADPPLIAVALQQERFTNELVQRGEEFALNIPPRRLVHHVQYLGSLRGEEIDKFEATQLETFYPVHITAPLISDCVAWVECEVQEVLPFGDHVLYIALPRLLQVRPEVFDERWKPGAPASMRPLLYLGGTHYATLGSEVTARAPRDLDAPEQVLAERMREDLELTQEARERREEALGHLRDEFEAGKVVDLDLLGIDLDEGDYSPDSTDPTRGGLDLSGAVLLGEPDPED